MSNNTISSSVSNPTQSESHRQFQDGTPAIVRTYLNALLASSQDDGRRYEEYFSYFTEANLPPPKRILDVDCGNGITTCFYATLYPEAKIIGIARSWDALACAKTLAAKLHLANVEFVDADVLHLPDNLKGTKFDLVCSTFVADRMLLCGLPPCILSVEDIMSGQSPLAIDEGGVEYAQALADLLADEQSKLVSFEKTFTPHFLASWLRSLQEAGIYVPEETFERLNFFGTGFLQQIDLPVMIGSKQVATLPTAEGIRGLWIGWPENFPEQEFYDDIEAEAVLAATDPKELLCSVLHEIPGMTDDAKTELWKTDSHVLIYKCRQDDRQLVRLPTQDPKRLGELLKEMLDNGQDLDD